MAYRPSKPDMGKREGMQTYNIEGVYFAFSWFFGISQILYPIKKQQR